MDEGVLNTIIILFNGQYLFIFFKTYGLKKKIRKNNTMKF